MDSTPPTKSEAPAEVKPVPAALMRNFHEVLRNDILKELAPLAAGPSPDFEAFAAAWGRHTHGMAFHAAMEEGAGAAGRGFFALIEDASAGAASADPFRAEHAEEGALKSALEAALAARDAQALSISCEAYKTWALAHLTHEEDIFMKFAPTLAKPVALHLRNEALQPAVATLGSHALDDFVRHGVASLARHGSSANPPHVATRVWLHALQAVAPPQDWQRLRMIALEAAGEEVWAAMLSQVPTL